MSVRSLERKRFQLATKSNLVDRSRISCVGSVFHARGAATEKAVSAIRRRVRGTTTSPDDEARRQCRSSEYIGNTASRTPRFSELKPRSRSYRPTTTTDRREFYFFVSLFKIHVYFSATVGHPNPAELLFFFSCNVELELSRSLVT